MSVNITSWTDLAAISEDLTAEYLLTADLSSADDDYADIGDSWVALGDAVGTKFTGGFNGQGHTISDLITTDNGLFGCISLCSVQKLGMINVNVSTGNMAGGITGQIDMDADVHDCYVIGDVVVSSDTCGGIAGNNYGTIYNCYAVVDIGASDWWAGGIGGYSPGSTISSYSVCLGTGTNYVGAVVGESTSGNMLNDGWFYQTGCPANAIGYDSGTSVPVELITYNIKVGGGAGWIDDSYDWFYDKTRNVYDAGATTWDFATPVWYEHAADYPDFEAPAPTGWTHKINGVAAANMAKVDGVAKADIAKVMGV